jgi:hypothetical protein
LWTSIGDTLSRRNLGEGGRLSPPAHAQQLGPREAVFSSRFLFHAAILPRPVGHRLSNQKYLRSMYLTPIRREGQMDVCVDIREILTALRTG